MVVKSWDTRFGRVHGNVNNKPRTGFFFPFCVVCQSKFPWHFLFPIFEKPWRLCFLQQFTDNLLYVCSFLMLSLSHCAAYCPPWRRDQINVGKLDPVTGKFTGESDVYALAGYLRGRGEADEALTCLVNKKDESEL